MNQQDLLFTLPLIKDSDFLDIRKRYLSDTYSSEKERLLTLIKYAYKNAPRFQNVMPVIEKCINFANNNLFEYTYYSIVQILEILDIKTEIITSSNIDIDHSLRNKYRVIEICKALGGDIYINSFGGMELYDKEEFQQHQLDLKFIKMSEIQYKQFNHPFVKDLSIIDVLMFNEPGEIQQLLNEYELL